MSRTSRVMKVDIRTMKKLGIVYLVNVAFRSTVVIIPDIFFAIKRFAFGSGDSMEGTIFVKAFLHPFLIFFFNLFELYLGIKFIKFYGSRGVLRRELSDMYIWVNFNVVFTFFYAVQSFIEKNWIVMLAEFVLRCFTFFYVLRYVDDLRLSFLVNPYIPRQVDDEEEDIELQ